jgi:hypothetical protein
MGFKLLALSSFLRKVSAASRSCPSFCEQRFIRQLTNPPVMPKRPTRKAAALAAVIAEGQQSTLSAPSKGLRGRRPRIMFIERKAGSLTGEARIGRVTFNRTGRTIYYRDQVFHRIIGGGFKSNHYEEATGEDYWISGCKRRGGDQLYATNVPIEIDEDVRLEYWRDIRGAPERANETTA